MMAPFSHFDHSQSSANQLLRALWYMCVCYLATAFQHVPITSLYWLVTLLKYEARVTKTNWISEYLLTRCYCRQPNWKICVQWNPLLLRRLPSTSLRSFIAGRICHILTEILFMNYSYLLTNILHTCLLLF